MKTREAQKLGQRLAEFFPGQLSGAEKAEAIRRFADYDFATVCRVMGDYWKQSKLEQARINLPAFFELCRTSHEEHRTRGTNAATQDQSTADVYRSQNPNNPDFQNASDAEVIIRTHRFWWFRARQQECYRSARRNGCRNELVGKTIGGLVLDHESAAPWAEIVFADPAHFDRCIADLRGDLQLSHAQK